MHQPLPTIARSNPISRWSASFAGFVSITLAGLLFGAIGCAKPDPAQPYASLPASATQPANLRAFDTFSATLDVPASWRFERTSISENHEHVTWISPGGNTAVGVLFFRMPFPVGHELAFKYGFLAEMKRKEGVATVIEKHWDPEIQGLRFTTESKYFRVEAKFFVRGMRGWAFYAGTRLGHPVNEGEFQQAQSARETGSFVAEVTK